MDAENSSFISAVDKVDSYSLKMKLVILGNLFIQRNQVKKEFQFQKQKLQNEYEDKYRPFYDKRLEVIEGKEDKFEGISEEITKLNIQDTANKEVGIPYFWMHAVYNCFQFKPLINEKDLKILQFLKDVRVVYPEDKVKEALKKDFSLEFYFGKNDYFDHEKLVKTYSLHPKSGIPYKIESTEIQWSTEECNPTIDKKKKKIKKKNEIKVITKVEEVASFFSFFKSYQYDENNVKTEKHTNPDEEEEEEDTMEVLEEEYNLGIFVKEDFIPLALEYYLGINPEEPADNEDEEEEEEDETQSEKRVKKKVITKEFK